MGHGLSSARSVVREPNYGPEGEIEWELIPWIAAEPPFFFNNLPS